MVNIRGYGPSLRWDAGGAGSSPGVAKFGTENLAENPCGTTLRGELKQIKQPNQKKPDLVLEVGLEIKRAKMVSLEGFVEINSCVASEALLGSRLTQG